MSQRVLTPRIEREPPRHGKISSYTNYGCRCEPCKGAWRDYYRRYRGKEKSSTGTVSLKV